MEAEEDEKYIHRQNAEEAEMLEAAKGLKRRRTFMRRGICAVPQGIGYGVRNVPAARSLLLVVRENKAYQNAKGNTIEIAK